MPHRTGLTQRLVAEKALQLVDTHGLDALSLRRLGADLGASPMALYTYFDDRERLLEAVTQLVYAEVSAPVDDAVGPEATVRGILESVRGAFLRHPHVLPLAARYPPRTLDALAFVEAGYRALSRAGVEAAAIARAYRMLAAYSIGSAEIEVNKYFGEHIAAFPSGSLDAPTLERHLPQVAEIGPLLAAQDDAEEFRYGLDLVLDAVLRRAASR
jgi:AcrR family transcriptional regulator